MRQLLRGAGDVGRGFRFLGANRRLWWWVVAPALVSLVVIVAIIWTVLAVAAPLVAFLSGSIVGLMMIAREGAAVAKRHGDRSRR